MLCGGAARTRAVAYRDQYRAYMLAAAWLHGSQVIERLENRWPNTIRNTIMSKPIRNSSEGWSVEVIAGRLPAQTSIHDKVLLPYYRAVLARPCEILPADVEECIASWAPAGPRVASRIGCSTSGVRRVRLSVRRRTPGVRAMQARLTETFRYHPAMHADYFRAVLTFCRRTTFLCRLARGPRSGDAIGYRYRLAVSDDGRAESPAALLGDEYAAGKRTGEIHPCFGFILMLTDRDDWIFYAAITIAADWSSPGASGHRTHSLRSRRRLTFSNSPLAKTCRYAEIQTTTGCSGKSSLSVDIRSRHHAGRCGERSRRLARLGLPCRLNHFPLNSTRSCMPETGRLRGNQQRFRRNDE